MSSIRDRIIQRMTDLKLRQVDLMDATGATKGAVSKWVSGTNVPSTEFMPALAAILKTSENWLLTGNQTPEFTQVKPWDSNTPLDDDEIEIPFFKDFSFACGGGSISEAVANETRKLRMSKATLRNLSAIRNKVWNLQLVVLACN